MPRVNLGPNTKPLTKLINRYAKAESDRRICDCLAAVNLSKTVYYDRMNEPEKFDLLELRKVARAFKIPWDELSKALEQAIKV